MKSFNHNIVVFKVNQDINFLKEDLRRAIHPSTKSYLKNAIIQKEAKLSLIIKKALTQPPEAPRKTLDKQTRSVIK